MRNSGLDEARILRLLHEALIKIRADAHEIGNWKAFRLADQFHTVPLQLARAAAGQITYGAVLKSIKRHPIKPAATCVQPNADKLLRTLTWFDKHGDDLIGEVRLRGATLPALQKLFHLPADNPMYDCYPVVPEHVAPLQRRADLRIDLDKYAYFVEAKSIPTPTRRRATSLA